MKQDELSGTHSKLQHVLFPQLHIPCGAAPQGRPIRIGSQAPTELQQCNPNPQGLAASILLPFTKVPLTLSKSMMYGFTMPPVVTWCHALDSLDMSQSQAWTVLEGEKSLVLGDNSGACAHDLAVRWTVLVWTHVANAIM